MDVTPPAAASVRHPLVRRWETQGIAGGWAIDWTHQGVQRRFDGGPRTIPGEIHAWLSTNRAGVTLDQVWQECNRQWLLRAERKRWMPGAGELLQAFAGIRNADPAKAAKNNTFTAKNIGPDMWGPVAWGFLHHFGALDTFNATMQEFWVFVTRRILPAWLDPEQNPRTGCSICTEHYRETLAQWPPELVKTHAEAAVWSWRAHDRVRQLQGKPRITFDQAAKIHGWDLKA